MATSYGGFYTRQEQQDAMAARLEPNPNRVGSGFINFGAMERQQQPAANWQTNSLMGGGGGNTPAQVSEIWNSAPAPPVQPPRSAQMQPQMQPQMQQQMQQQMQPQMQPQMQMQPQLSAQQAFAPPPPAGPSVPSVGNLFQSLGLDAAPQRSVSQPLSAVGGSAPYVGSLDVNAMSAAAVQQPFIPGSTLQQQAQPSQSLMSLLQTPTSSAPQAQPSLAYNPLCNGSMSQNACASRAQAAFGNPIAAAPQCQLPPNGVHSAAFAGGAFSAPVPHQPPQQRAPANPSRSLHSTSDYASAAVNYKPPAPSRSAAAMAPSNVSRKPVASNSQPAQAPQKDEWECPRCTFLNNDAIRECEMCGFERAGKELEQPAVTTEAEDNGWQTASSTVRKSAPAAAAGQCNKSKTQAKNEKRRAKKRSD